MVVDNNRINFSQVNLTYWIFRFHIPFDFKHFYAYEKSIIAMGVIVIALAITIIFKRRFVVENLIVIWTYQKMVAKLFIYK